MDQAASQGNESFQYTAPRQPKKTSANAGPPTQKSAPPPGAPAVLLATAVHAYRYVNGQYMKQGKLGAAVLGNHTAREYKILIYASQQKQVTAARIHPGFVFTVQPSNYCTFYDDQRQNWSLMFESEKAAMDFCKEVCLAKGNGTPSLDSVVVQDLVLGEGQGVENGDSLEVAYTGWLLQNHTIGQMFDSNLNKDKLLRMKLGLGKVIKGWEEGMLGMKKGGRRLMVVPPSQAYGSQGIPNRVPPDSTLIFETEIRRVKFAKDSGSDRVSGGSRDSAASSPAPSLDSSGPDVAMQPPAHIPPKPGELPLRAKSNSLSEQLTNPDVTKAKLISRMAKMGQPMLPFLAGAVSSQPDSSDSEMEDPSVSRMKDNPAAPSPVPISATPPASAQAPSRPIAGVTAPSAALLPVSMTTANPQHLIPGPTHAFQPYSYSQTSVAPVGQMYPPQTVPYQGDITSFLMTEARQHNTEIRLAVGKVADKVDQLASKVDDLQKQGGISLGLSNVSMETTMIMHNIQRIIQENECLKKEVFEKSSRIEEQNRKIGELINQNQRYMEQSNLLMEQRNDSLKSSSEQNQARMLQAEQDKVWLTEELASSTARVSQLQLEASSHQQRAAELQAKLSAALQDVERHSTQASSLETQVEELKEGVERTQTQYRTEKQKRKEVELKLSNMEEELQDLKTEKDNLDRTLADRKRKWQAERQRCDEELEEVRRSSQLELDSLRSQLRRARTSTDQATAEQLAQLQAELEAEWKGKCEQALALAKEQQGRELAELAEQKEAVEQKLAQLQEKFSALKQSRDSEDQRLLQQQEQGEELQALKEKYAALQEKAGSVKVQLETRVAEMEKRLAEQELVDTAGEVKRVMNGVFHSLRGEFDLQETYTGHAVLGVIVSTIKNVTLQLLTKNERTMSQRSENDGTEEEEEDESNVKSKAEAVQQKVQQNGEEEEEKEEEEEQEDQMYLVQVKKDESQVKEGHTHQPEGEEIEPEVPKVQEQPAQEEPRENGDAGQETEICTMETSPRQLQEGNHMVAVEQTMAKPAEAPTPDPEQKTDMEVEEMDVEKECVSDEGPPKDIEGTEVTPMGPPTQPPPPPSALQEKTETSHSTSLTEGVEEENGEEPFFQNAAPTKPPPPPTEEEDDEPSMKGRPPPAPLFGDDDDEDDLDWLG
ncbi:hypothetical protein JZ751_001316 [Albula glossodonta]|uniref:peptidylprolyl isomerase n=1 Tax=Albula glossodonta TaxID=121402 RepID=A0A8T2PTC6_9TELE|nr:hypothetical protein JZ751_001316 [Albula glossodonta]